MEHIDESDDVRVLEFFQESDFTDGSRWDSLVLRLESDFLEGKDLTSVSVTCFVDDTVGSFSDDFDFLVLVNFGFHFD